MKRIEILTEEASMKCVLEIILPKIVPDTWKLNQNYFIRSHSGKSDLQKSIPLKIKAFCNDSVGFIIVHDQDSWDCKELKNKLISLCKENKNKPLLIRIVCRELESWYLGDMKALKTAYPRCKKISESKLKNPDILNAKNELKKIMPAFGGQIEIAKKVSPHLNLESREENKSYSFRIFIEGIKKFFNENSYN